MTALGMIRPRGYFRRTSRYPPARGPAGGTCAKFHGGVLLLRHVRGACGADAACILSLPLSALQLSFIGSIYLAAFNPSSVFCAIRTFAPLRPRFLTSLLRAPRQIHALQSIQIPLARETSLFYTFIYRNFPPSRVEPTSACGAAS